MKARRPPPKPTTKPGLNRFVWDLHYADTTKFPGLIYWAANNRGPLATPGTYTVELTATVENQAHTETQTVLLKPDPASPPPPTITPNNFH